MSQASRSVTAAVSPGSATALKIDFDRGLVVRGVLAGGAAAKAAIVEGDVLLSVDGTPVNSLVDLAAAVMPPRPTIAPNSRCLGTAQRATSQFRFKADASSCARKTASSSALVTYYVGATNGDSGAIERGSFLAVGLRLSRRTVRRRAGSGNRGRRGDRPQPCDGGDLRGLPSRSSGVGEPKGFRKISAQPGAPLIHKLNLSVLRVLGAISRSPRCSPSVPFWRLSSNSSGAKRRIDAARARRANFAVGALEFPLLRRIIGEAQCQDG